MLILISVLVFVISLIDYRIGAALLCAQFILWMVLLWRANPPAGTPKAFQPEPVRREDEERSAVNTVYWQNRYRASKGLPRIGE